MLNEIQKKEIKSELELLFAKIGSQGYFGEKVQDFYQELRKKLQKYNKEEFLRWLKREVPSFLREAHPGKIYIMVGIFKIFSVPKEIINLGGVQILKILQQELEKLSQDPLLGAAPRNLDLRLGCIKFFSEFQKALDDKNQKAFLEVFRQMEASENETEIIKKYIKSFVRDYF